MYVRNEYDLGSVIDIENHYPGNFGAPGMPRSKKRKKTPDDMTRQNKTNREKKLQRLILANFQEGDWHLILEYKKENRPQSYDQAKKEVQKFLREMRREYKAAGFEFKYIYITERGKQGSCHHHLVIQDIATHNLYTKKLVLKHWNKGSKRFTPLYEDGEYKRLAEYIVKKETKEENAGCSYSRSRNLIIPQKKRKILHRKRWLYDPKPKKGYYIIKDSVVNGINPVTGYPYQHYSMKRIGGSDG